MPNRRRDDYVEDDWDKEMHREEVDDEDDDAEQEETSIDETEELTEIEKETKERRGRGRREYVKQEEELDYILRARENEDQSAWEALIKQYEPLINRMASSRHRTFPKSILWEDLISAGYEGVVKAVRNYDPSKNTKFMTLVYQCINFEMGHLHTTHNYTKNRSDVLAGMNRGELAGVSIDDRQGDPKGEGEGRSLHEVIADDSDKLSKEHDLASEMADKLIAYVQNEVARDYFLSSSIDSRVNQSVIAEKYGLSRERVRQIIGKEQRRINNALERAKFVHTLVVVEKTSKETVSESMHISIEEINHSLALYRYIFEHGPAVVLTLKDKKQKEETVVKKPETPSRKPRSRTNNATDEVKLYEPRELHFLPAVKAVANSFSRDKNLQRYAKIRRMKLLFEDVATEYDITREQYRALIKQYDEFVGAIMQKSRIAISTPIEDTGMNPREYAFYRTMYDLINRCQGKGPAKNPIEKAIVLKALHGNSKVSIKDDVLYGMYVLGESDEDIMERLSITESSLHDAKRRAEKVLAESIDKMVKVRTALESGLSPQMVATYVGGSESVIKELEKVCQEVFNYTKASLELNPIQVENDATPIVDDENSTSIVGDGVSTSRMDDAQNDVDTFVLETTASPVGATAEGSPQNVEMENAQTADSTKTIIDVQTLKSTAEVTTLEFIDVGEGVFNQLKAQMSGEYERTEEVISLIKLLEPVYKQDKRRGKSFTKYLYDYYVDGASNEKIANVSGVAQRTVKAFRSTLVRELLNYLQLSRYCKKAISSGEDKIGVIGIVSSLLGIESGDVYQFASLYDYVFHGGRVPTNTKLIALRSKENEDLLKEVRKKVGLGASESSDEAPRENIDSADKNKSANSSGRAKTKRTDEYERTDEMIRIVKLLAPVYKPHTKQNEVFQKYTYEYYVNNLDSKAAAAVYGVSVHSATHNRNHSIKQMQCYIALSAYSKMALALGEDKVEFIASSLEIKKTDVIQYASLYDYLYSGAEIPKIDHLIGFVNNKSRTVALEQVGEEIARDFRVLVENSASPVGDGENNASPVGATAEGLPQNVEMENAQTAELTQTIIDVPTTEQTTDPEPIETTNNSSSLSQQPTDDETPEQLQKTENGTPRAVEASAPTIGKTTEPNVGDGFQTSREDDAQNDVDTFVPEPTALTTETQTAESTENTHKRRGRRKKTSDKSGIADHPQTFTKTTVIEKLAGLFEYDMRIFALKSLIVDGKSNAEVASSLGLPDETFLRGIIDDAEIELLQIMADTKKAVRSGDEGFYRNLYNYLLNDGAKPRVNMIEQLKIVDMLEEDLMVTIDFESYRKWLESGIRINRFCEESGCVGSTLKRTRNKIQEEMALALACHEKTGTMSNKAIAKSLNIEEEDIARYLDYYQRIFMGSDPMRAMRIEKKARLAVVLDQLNAEDRNLVEGYLTRNETPVEISKRSGMTIKATKFKLLSIMKELEALAGFKEENSVNVPKRMGRHPALGKYISIIYQLQPIFAEESNFAIVYSCIIEGRVQQEVAKENDTSSTKIGRDVKKTAERLQWYVDSANTIFENMNSDGKVQDGLLEELGIPCESLEYFTKLYEFLNGDVTKVDEIKEYFIKDLESHMKPLRDRTNSSTKSMGKDKDKLQFIITALKPLLEGARAFDILYDSAIVGKSLKQLTVDYNINASNVSLNKKCGFIAIQQLMERAEACYKGRVDEGKSSHTIAELLNLPEETVEMYIKLREFVYSGGETVDIKDTFDKEVRIIRNSIKHQESKLTKKSTVHKAESSEKKKEVKQKEKKQSPLVSSYIRLKPILGDDEVFMYAYQNVVEGEAQDSIASRLNVSQSKICRDITKASAKVKAYVEKTTKIHERVESKGKLSTDDLLGFNLEEGEAEYYLNLYDAMNGGEVRAEVAEYFVRDLQRAFVQKNKDREPEEKRIIEKLKPIFTGDVRYDAVYAHKIEGKSLTEISREAGVTSSVGWQRKVAFERGIEKLLSQAEVCYKGLHETDSQIGEVAKTLSLPEESVELCSKFYEFIYLDGEPVDIKQEYLKIVNPSIVKKENNAKKKEEEHKAKQEARAKREQESAERKAQKQAEKVKKAQERERKKNEIQEKQARERAEKEAQKQAEKNKVPTLDAKDLMLKLELIFPHSYRIKALKAEVVDGVPFEETLKALGFMGEDIERTKEATGEWVKDFVLSVHTIGKKTTQTRVFEKVKQYNMSERDIKFYEDCYHVLFKNQEVKVDNTYELARVSKLLKASDSVKISNDYIESIVIEGRSTAEIAKDKGVTTVAVLNRLASERKKLDFAVSTLQGMLSDAVGGKPIETIASEKGTDSKTVVGMINLAHQVFFAEPQTEQFTLTEVQFTPEEETLVQEEVAPEVEPKDLMTLVHESLQKTDSTLETSKELDIELADVVYYDRLYSHIHDGGAKPIRIDDVPFNEVLEKLKQVYPENEKIDLLYRLHCEGKSLKQMANEDGYTYGGLIAKKGRCTQQVQRVLKRFESYYTKVAFGGESISEVATSAGQTEREIAFNIQLMRAIYCGKPMPDASRRGHEFDDSIKAGRTASTLSMQKRGQKKASEKKRTEVHVAQEKKPLTFEEYRQECKQKTKRFMLSKKTSSDLQMYYNGEDMSVVTKKLGLPLHSAIDSIINLSMMYARDSRKRSLKVSKVSHAPTDYEIFVAVVPYDKELYQEPLTGFYRLFGCIPKGSYSKLLRAVDNAVRKADPAVKDHIYSTYGKENDRGVLEFDYAEMLNGTDPAVRRLYNSIRTEFTFILDRCRNNPQEM